MNFIISHMLMQAREGECVYDWTAYAVFWSMTNKDDQPVLFEKSNNIYMYKL